MTHEPLIRIGAPPPGHKRRDWHRSRWVPLVAAVAAVGVFLTGMVGMHLIRPQLQAAIAPSFAPQPFSVSGFMALELGGFVWDRDPDVCAGKGGYDDIRAGTQVVVTDPSGTTIALGQLDPGIPRRDPDNASRATQCRFPFQVTNVPGGHEFYGIAVGRRGKLEYTRDKIVLPLELTLS